MTPSCWILPITEFLETVSLSAVPVALFDFELALQIKRMNMMLRDNPQV